ncbi:MAG: response regulator, partial [Verrucomicrobia bacterium]|nr:response regulator [Verrucomicrobiota bacterium]
DVTERKQALERVREQAAMLEHAREAIIVRELPGGTIKFWNRGAERMYGWTAAETAGGDMGELLLGDPSGNSAMDEDLLRCGEWRGEQKHATKSGGTLTVGSHATLIRDDEGEPSAVLVINIDVTEQRNLEARFLRAQRMESIGTLASGIAHDLNNILSPIMMSAPLLRLELDPAQRESIVSTIEVSAQRGAEIVRQVLAFGRGLEGARGLLRIDAAISEVLRILQETFPKSISLEGRIERPLHPVLGDATQLHQVLLNLCVNARDAMPEGGRLVLSARNVELDAEGAGRLPGLRAGPHVLLEVSDTGTGIEPAVAEHIFEPFYTTKGVGGGTGLGLSTVLGIVRSHGGAIQLESKSGEGTTFQIHLPAAEGGHSSAAHTALPEFPRARGETVLVVDDEPAVLTAARLILENAGYRVLTAANGAEGLAVYTQDPKVAAVLTDLMMPVLDGLNFIRSLRRMDPALPIIASTGLGEKRQTEALTPLGVQKTLLKPYDATALLETLSELLRSGGESSR